MGRSPGLSCLLTSIAVHVTVDKGFHLICDIVPVLATDPFLMFQLAGVVALSQAL